MNIDQKNRIVIKVGSSSIIDNKNQQIRRSQMKSIADDVSWLMKSLNKQVTLMSSGALAQGRIAMKKMAMDDAAQKNQQILGAVGQVVVSSAWADAFREHDILIGQLLLTPESASSKIVKQTIEQMLKQGIVPYINENIPIMDEYDNDGLSAIIASQMKCDLLILLSDVDGVYNANPMTDKSTKKIKVINDIDEAIIKFGGGSASGVGTGGMLTKLNAAKAMSRIGIDTVIASGEMKNPIKAILSGDNGTLINH